MRAIAVLAVLAVSMLSGLPQTAYAAMCVDRFVMPISGYVGTDKGKQEEACARIIFDKLLGVMPVNHTKRSVFLIFADGEVSANCLQTADGMYVSMSSWSADRNKACPILELVKKQIMAERRGS